MELYIHIPFCVKKCGYCDFLSVPVGTAGEGKREDGVPEDYMGCLLKEIQMENFRYVDQKVSSVFIGGGTPSLMSPAQTERLLKMLSESFAFLPEAEITIEANPGTLTPEKLKTYRTCGVNRLSIGLQSADDKELKLLGRIHTYDEFLKNYEQARECGLENINVDLISGLPGQTADGWGRTLEKIARLDPEHISAYGLIVEEGTPFYDRYGAEGMKGGSESPGLPDEETERQMYHDTVDILRKYGYRQYEISNYAKEGYECRHNTGYWTRKEYVGFGPGAASMMDNERWKNTSDIRRYMDIMSGKEGQILKEETQTLSREEQMEETMFLGLRMNRGVSLGGFRERYGIPMQEVYGNWIRKMTDEGLLLMDDDRARLSTRGRDLANYVIAGFIGN